MVWTLTIFRNEPGWLGRMHCPSSQFLSSLSTTCTLWKVLLIWINFYCRKNISFIYLYCYCLISDIWYLISICALNLCFEQHHIDRWKYIVSSICGKTVSSYLSCKAISFAISFTRRFWLVFLNCRERELRPLVPDNYQVKISTQEE